MSFVIKYLKRCSPCLHTAQDKSKTSFSGVLKAKAFHAINKKKIKDSNNAVHFNSFLIIRKLQKTLFLILSLTISLWGKKMKIFSCKIPL